MFVRGDLFSTEISIFENKQHIFIEIHPHNFNDTMIVVDDKEYLLENTHYSKKLRSEPALFYIKNNKW